MDYGLNILNNRPLLKWKERFILQFQGMRFLWFHYDQNHSCRFVRSKECNNTDLGLWILVQHAITLVRVERLEAVLAPAEDVAHAPVLVPLAARSGTGGHGAAAPLAAPPDQKAERHQQRERHGDRGRHHHARVHVRGAAQLGHAAVLRRGRGGGHIRDSLGRGSWG